LTSGRSFLSILKEIREGTTSCEERVRYHLEKIRQGESTHCFLTVYEEEALRQAQVVDEKIRRNKGGRLAGLVVALKDVLAFEGHPLQAASRILNGFESPYSATAVQRLVEADAIIIGRNNCDEFGMGSSNENSAFGPVTHGTHPDRVPGGSSGGSAVAVMMDMCQVALGSDTGGSVRQPASFCGVIGLKPTYGRISRYGLVAFASSFDCIGVIGRHPEDIALVLEVISGPDENDSTVSRREVDNYHEALKRTTAQFRICTIRGIAQAAGIQSEVREGFLQLIGQVKSKGHTVDEIDFPLNEFALPAYYLLTTAEASSNLGRYDGVRYGYRGRNGVSPETMYKSTRSIGFGPEVQRRIMLGTFVLSSDYYDTYYARAQKVRRRIREETRRLFRDHDFILMPTSPTTAFPLGAHKHDPLEMYLADVFSVHANVAGIPAVSVPYGHDRQGLPIGMQLLADDFEEGKLLAMTKEIMTMTA
jgi:aspartyl-tRNA(Asn)/glutamyl-tRNA(Gln) amidotransferase subunit A